MALLAQGAAIALILGTATVTSCDIHNNNADGERGFHTVWYEAAGIHVSLAGGGALAVLNGSASVSGSTITGCTAIASEFIAAAGGALVVFGGSASVSGSTITGCKATTSGFFAVLGGALAVYRQSHRPASLRSSQWAV